MLIAAASLGQALDSTAVEQQADSVSAISATEEAAGDEAVHKQELTTEIDAPTPFFSLPTYRISIGASFDFIDKFNASNVYGDLMVDLPEALRTRKATCGFLGGIYQVRSVSVDSFIPEQLYLISTTPLSGFDIEEGGDSAVIHASSAGGVKRIVADNHCFFASMYRPWYLATGTPGSSGIYHLFYFGLVHRRERISETYVSTEHDQVYIAANPGLPPLPSDRQYTQSRNDILLGYGQMLRHEFDDLALQFYGVVTCMPSPWRGGYLMSFNAVGSRSGLIAGAEIRLDPLIGGQQYNVFLAKTFKLAEMAKLITSY